MKPNLQALHEECKRFYDRVCQIPLDADGEQAAYDAAGVLLQACNQARDSVFWGRDRRYVRHLEDPQPWEDEE